ncbi:MULTISPECIES: response regulator [Spirosoma]|uniref:Response regulator n=1 Tax=Spirosoma liriopis TaxID=2937440 RepID=A0ABT0HE42_9BACT|nr:MULTISPECIES: response regulator [Spirosoma]MCK8490419.1 response regulator [Spirosoma liriopis]UHG89792.1 response regulator [Spirosoma oryzicola]
MTPDDKRRHLRRSFPLLVVEDNKDHQLLIAFGLREKMPLAQPVMASTLEEAVIHLQITAAEQRDFPRLVLLDLNLPSSDQGFELLKRIREDYPRLPIVVLSHNEDSAIIAKAYELGAHSFITKPLGLEQWENYFRALNDYWIDTVTLVPRNY